MAYSKRYAGGFFDKPNTTTPIDSVFLNAVEAALLKLNGVDPTTDGQVLQWDAANTRFGPALLLNKNIDAGAAIDKSKLNLAGQITDADIAGAAAIAKSKLNLAGGIVDADINAVAAIAFSKIAVGGTSRQFVRGDGTFGSTMELVQTITRATDGTFDFTGIPAVAKASLLIRGQARGTGASFADTMRMLINNDSGANYDYMVQGNRTAGALTRGPQVAGTFAQVADVAAASQTAGAASTFEIFIPYYSGTTFRKQWKCRSWFKNAAETDGTNYCESNGGGEWRSTAAINQITLSGTLAANWLTGSQASLYLIYG